ncbi:MAG: DUF899 family protein [Phenylobacterium sp.]|uniref:DUF899 family protein n=1 Tax=Phenylobacterium sp. TaxID=1871053 RepID=UPI002732F088|nr:DUF899 family protein [Phenylobacterium sp.]MDP3173171.1 DUF899 family protein [Phenylobacterium sp.]
MDYAQTRETLSGHRARIEALRAEMRQIQADVIPQPVADYELSRPGGPVRLSELFGAKDDLFVIHNMGTGCPACTMWADGFNGVYDHLADRAAFVVSSPNTPDVQRAFAAGRGWRFPMVSHQGTSFAADMGYHRNGGWQPGLSVFQRQGDQILRVSDTELGPNDDFCSAWHMFAMLPQGAAGWFPKFNYA